MAAATNTSYDALLKEVWPQKDIFDAVFDQKQSFFGMVPKTTDFYEKRRHIAVGLTHTQGLSAKFDQALNNQQPTVQKEFIITPVTYYSFFSIARQLLRRSKSDKASILSALEREPQKAIYGWKRVNGIYLGNQSGIGDLARMASFSGAVITLAGNADAVTKRFEVGMTLEISVDNSGVAGVQTVVSPLRVTKVDREAGTLTCNQNVLAAIPTAGQTDYLYRAGDYNSIISGPYAWCPITTPTSTPFFSLDRSTEPQRLGGWRVNTKNLSPRMALKKTVKVLAENGGDPTHAFYSPNDHLNLSAECESSGGIKRIQEAGAAINKYRFGIPYEGIEVMGPNGPIKCMFDINMNDNYPLVTQLSTWTFASMGEAPYFDDTDGNRILREASADAYGGRIIGDMQLYNECPMASAINLLKGA